jgi:hypothetical protein
MVVRMVGLGRLGRRVLGSRGVGRKAVESGPTQPPGRAMGGPMEAPPGQRRPLSPVAGATRAGRAHARFSEPWLTPKSGPRPSPASNPRCLASTGRRRPHPHVDNVFQSYTWLVVDSTYPCWRLSSLFVVIIAALRQPHKNAGKVMSGARTVAGAGCCTARSCGFWLLEAQDLGSGGFGRLPRGRPHGLLESSELWPELAQVKRPQIRSHRSPPPHLHQRHPLIIRADWKHFLGAHIGCFFRERIGERRIDQSVRIEGEQY